MFKSFKLVALIFIEAFNIYYKLVHPPHRSSADNQTQFQEKQAYQKPNPVRGLWYKL